MAFMDLQLVLNGRALRLEAAIAVWGTRPDGIGGYLHRQTSSNELP